MSTFENGYKNFEKNIGNIGISSGSNYVNDVEKEIINLERQMNALKGNNRGIEQLKGNVAEIWHSGTHNIDAVIKQVDSRTEVPNVNTFGSADIESNFKKDFGLKYYKNGTESAKQQSTSYFERYRADKGSTSFEEFLNKRGISESDVLAHESIYNGQTRIIPKEQMDEAISFLHRKINEEGIKRPELAKKYKETLEKLTDKIKSSKGSESIALTELESKEIARMAKDGLFESEKFGITTEELIKFKNIMNQSLKAGLTAATISAVLKITPELFRIIENLIKNGEIDIEQFKKTGFEGLNSGAEGFLRGSISSMITSSCLSGQLGATLKTVDPTLIGVATVLTMNAIQNSYKLAKNEITKQEFVDSCFRDLFISSCSIYMGSVVQGLIEIPILGYLIGSFIGSMGGAFIYDVGYNKCLSFCVDSGFTFFGIVKQDYKLPNEVLNALGIKVFEYEKFIPKKIDIIKFEYKKFTPITFVQKKIDIVIVRRGVIGVSTIGYV